MNENEKMELIRSMTAVEVKPEIAKEEIASHSYNKVPLSRIPALGVGFEPLTAALQQVLSGGEAVSGIYRVTIPAGTQLGQFKQSTDFFGAAFKSGRIEAQAHLSPLMFSPAAVGTLFMAATLANIDKKLDAIQETQQEMLDFLKAKEKSALMGDLEFLADVFNNYKYNWNSEKYKTANHIKAMDIRQSAMHSLELYQSQIQKHMEKRSIMPSDRDVKKQLEQLIDEMQDYRLALYIYGFAYLVEVLLQENFDAQYLASIASSINDKALEYRELYTKVYTKAEERAKSTLQSKALGALSAVSRTAGKTVEKIPVISKSQLDENLINAGEVLGEHSETRTDSALGRLTEYSGDCVRPFVEQIRAIDRVYNSPMNILFDSENVYLGSA